MVLPAERRRYPRLHSYLPIRFYPAGSPRYLDTLTKDLSVGGVRVVTDLFLPTASDVVVELPLYRNTAPIYSRAKVMWTQHIRYSDQYQVGLEFLELPPERRRDLVTYVQDALAPLAATASP